MNEQQGREILEAAFKASFGAVHVLMKVSEARCLNRRV